MVGNGGRVARRHYWHTLKQRHVRAWKIYIADVWEDRRLVAAMFRATMVTNAFHRYLNSYRAHSYVRDQWRHFMELQARKRELWGHVRMMVTPVDWDNSQGGQWRQYMYV